MSFHFMLHSPSAVILEPKKRKSVTVYTFSPSICHKVSEGTTCHDHRGHSVGNKQEPQLYALLSMCGLDDECAFTDSERSKVIGH